MKRSHANLLSVVFGISGATALIYEIVWSRLLQPIFGSTLYSTSTLFAAFLLGFSIGAFALRNHADTTKQPLVQLALIEIAIGLYGIFITNIFSAINTVYLSLPPNNLITLLLLFTILLPPTILFGAIWPFVNSLIIREPGTVRRSSAALYSISSLGSALEAFASGFIFLVPVLGFKTTSALAGIINISARLLRLILAIRTSSEPTNASQHNLQPQSARPAAPIPDTTAGTFSIWNGCINLSSLLDQANHFSSSVHGICCCANSNHINAGVGARQLYRAVLYRCCVQAIASLFNG